MRKLIFAKPFKKLLKRELFQDIIYRVLSRENTAILPLNFYFIRGEIEKQFKCRAYPHEFHPMRKLAIINKRDYYVLIDCGDGIRDNLEINEYCGKLYKFIFSTKLTNPFFYFKVNFSPIKSKNIVKLAKEYNGIVMQCMPWSSYKASYQYFFKNRFFLRKKIKETLKKYDIVFFGTIKDYYYPAPYKDKRIKYPISITDAASLYKKRIPENSKRFFLLKPSRTDYWKEIMLDKAHKVKTIFSQPVPFNVYLNNILKAKLNFCPPGIGQIIHKVYENIAIGLPSIIPESSYQFPSPLNISDVGIVYNGKNDFTSQLLNFLEENKFREVHEKCIRIFDNFLTPEAIVKDMIDKISAVF